MVSSHSRLSCVFGFPCFDPFFFVLLAAETEREISEFEFGGLSSWFTATCSVVIFFNDIPRHFDYHIYPDTVGRMGCPAILLFIMGIELAGVSVNAAVSESLFICNCDVSHPQVVRANCIATSDDVPPLDTISLECGSYNTDIIE
jgi:hypothetical protein